MEQAAFVIFREALEITIILSVCMAATVGMPGRLRWIGAGVGMGVLGASVIAFFTEVISESFEGSGQELMNAGILLAAALMIGWTVVWMKGHAREMTQQMRQVGRDVIEGRTHARVLAGVIALAVFREGSEIVLFSYGMLVSGTPVGVFLQGVVLGMSGGLLLGGLLYLGLVKFSTRHVLSISSWLLAFVAAGLAAKGVSYLVAAGVLPELYGSVWNSTGFLGTDGILGGALSVLVGYDANPNAMQLIAYLLVLATLFVAMKLAGQTRPTVTMRG